MTNFEKEILATNNENEMSDEFAQLKYNVVSTFIQRFFDVMDVRWTLI